MNLQSFLSITRKLNVENANLSNYKLHHSWVYNLKLSAHLHPQDPDQMWNFEPDNSQAM